MWHRDINKLVLTSIAGPKYCPRTTFIGHRALLHLALRVVLVHSSSSKQTKVQLVDRSRAEAATTIYAFIVSRKQINNRPVAAALQKRNKNDLR